VLAGIVNVFFEGIAQIDLESPTPVFGAVAYPLYGVIVGLMVVGVVVREVLNCISPIDTIVPLFKVYGKDEIEK